MSRRINRLKYKKQLLHLESEDLKRNIRQLKVSLEWYKSELLSMHELGILESIIEKCLQEQREVCARKYKMQSQDTVSTRSVHEDILNAKIKSDYLSKILTVDKETYSIES